VVPVPFVGAFVVLFEQPKNATDPISARNASGITFFIGLNLEIMIVQAVY